MRLASTTGALIYRLQRESQQAQPTSLQLVLFSLHALLGLLQFLHLLEQGRLLQDIGENDITDAASANEHVLQFREFSVARSHRDARQLAVHVVLGFHQVASVLLSIREFHDHRAALSLVE